MSDSTAVLTERRARRLPFRRQPSEQRTLPRRGSRRVLPVGPTVTTIAVLAVLVLVVSAATGPVAVSPLDAAKIVIGHLIPGMPWMTDGTLTPLQDQAVWQFRVPRSLLAALSGAGLALAGAMMQAVVRNPLAEPYILGVSSGASVGAVLVIVSGGATFLGLSMSGAAFVGAMVACLLVAMLARIRGELSPTRMILAGVALGALLSAVTSYLTLTTDAQNVVSVMFFLLGSVSAADMSTLLIPAVALAIACIAVFGLSRSMNALLAGDESAMAVGVRTTRVRGVLLVLASLLTGAIVAVSGGIGFVGLVVPHMARLLVGSDHRRMLPITILGGALFLMVADLLARTVAMPTEIPLGILTAFVGAPFFLWLMRSGGDRAGFDR
ncbi:iron ABC transporter permease [Microbacterium oxydans]|uniref:Hemin transport system permease protein HmuU n=1 Tax=Microbacterium oxydans TaxID=82380 RepID=A0A3S9WGD5_9MICO|nr:MULTISPECIES: iron ABC transporter permease [Microbacterium]AZS39113.1 Hemin transport system permease protein HmuU [Microbacterium oxydans]MCB8043864.1 iron ABC transporter permease [Microbacterium oxydans]NYF29437.1 iron complex transport system permease protein [Microbacterium sp. JAI119]GED40350.1 iron ABC transporter permease [Microbacterium oxydans]